MSKKHQQKVEVRTSVPFVISRRGQSGLSKARDIGKYDHRVKHLTREPRRPSVG